MLTIFSDGGARGNPGQAACAFVIFKNDKLQAQDAKYLKITTNNTAEYNGVILALRKVVEEKLQSEEITFKMDSELVVRQLTGKYKIKDKKLIDLALEVKKIIKENNLNINFVHVPRSENKLADKLVNEKLDEESLSASL